MGNSIVDIIKQAKDKALVAYLKSKKVDYSTGVNDGRSTAYMFVLSLLKKNKVEEKLKALEILKNKFAITLVFYPYEEVNNFIRFIGKTDYEKTGLEKRAVEKITAEECAILREAFTDTEKAPNINFINEIVKHKEKKKMESNNDLQNEASKKTEPSCVVSWEQVGEMSGDCTCSYNIELKPNTTLKEFVDYVLSKKSERGYLRLFGKCRVEYRGSEIIGENSLLPFYDRKIKKVVGNGGYSCMDYFITLEE